MKQPEEMPDKSLKPFGWLAGFYTNICSDCEVHHIAAKRSWRCKECAEKAKVKHDEQPRADLAAEPDKVDVEEMPAVLLYLLGEGELDGCRYPDFPDNGEKYKRRYWWRKALREAWYSRNLIPPAEPKKCARCNGTGYWGWSEAPDLFECEGCKTSPVEPVRGDEDDAFYNIVEQAVNECFGEPDEMTEYRVDLGNIQALCFNIRARQSQSPAHDLDKIVERLGCARRCMNNVISQSPMGSITFEQAASARDYIDAAIEAVKQVRG